MFGEGSEVPSCGRNQNTNFRIPPRECECNSLTIAHLLHQTAQPDCASDTVSVVWLCADS
eukprot:3591913-Amphidinium_carterae.1